jgi:hypothetical protein
VRRAASVSGASDHGTVLCGGWTPQSVFGRSNVGGASPYSDGVRIAGILLATAGVALAVYSIPATWVAFAFFAVGVTSAVIGLRLAFRRR